MAPDLDTKQLSGKYLEKLLDWGTFEAFKAAIAWTRINFI